MCGCLKEKGGKAPLDVFACEALVEEREAACRACDRIVPVVEVCGVCKCFLGVKRRIKAAKCPLGKW